MEPVKAAENPAAANDGADVHHEAAGLHARPLAWRLGYALVAAPVMAICAGLLDGPWAAGFAYALLLLGVTSIWRAMLPRGPMERVRQEENRGVGKGVVSGAWTMAWCGCLLVGTPMLASWAGFIDGSGTTFFAYTLQLLGVVTIIAAMLLLVLAKLKID